jgi:putative tryptophan/tyrosine transport system substrate-binding protein
MMDRRTLLLGGCGALTASTLHAQTPPRRPLVGFVSAVGRNAGHVAALEQGLREAGVEPGRTIDIAERHADGDLARMKGHIDELVKSGASVFVTAGDNAMRLIQDSAPRVPIVVAVLGNYGNVVIGGSLSRPPGNVTGFSNLSAELAAKRLDILREIVPGLTRVALLVNRQIANSTGQPEAYRNGARSLGIDLREVTVEQGNDIVVALAEAKAAGARGVVVYRNFLFETRHKGVLAAIAAAGLPSMFEERFFVEGGGLISYSTNLVDLFRRSGGYVARILAGARPGDLPIQLPTRFELVINGKTANALGLTIPPTLLAFADEVIE